MSKEQKDCLVPERNPHATERLVKLLHQYPGLDFEPLLEHVTAFESPEAFEDLSTT